MRIGIGGMGWRPDDFWAATLTEFYEAIEGHNEAQGGDETTEKAPTASEVDALVARYG